MHVFLNQFTFFFILIYKTVLLNFCMAKYLNALYITSFLPQKIFNFVCLIRFFTSQSTIFQLCQDGSSWVEPVLSKAQGHNAVTPVRLKPAALRSRVKHSTTEPLHSHIQLCFSSLCLLLTLGGALIKKLLWDLNKINEQWHEISNNVVCVTNKGSNQPAHMRSLIRAFASRLNILWLLSYWRNIIWSF